MEPVSGRPDGRVWEALGRCESVAIDPAYTGLSPAPGVVSHETHLPAEEAQARPYSRVPRSHANPRRATHAQAPARQRPQAPDGLMMGLPGARPRTGRMRLSRSADFDRVFRQGRSHAGREFVLYVFPRGEGDEPRLGLSVSRKVGGAVERNRVKRLLREAFAIDGDRLPAGTDAVVVARHEANALAEREGLTGIRRALGQLLERVDPGGSDRAGSIESVEESMELVQPKASAGVGDGDESAEGA